MFYPCSILVFAIPDSSVGYAVCTLFLVHWHSLRWILCHNICLIAHIAPGTLHMLSLHLYQYRMLHDMHFLYLHAYRMVCYIRLLDLAHLHAFWMLRYTLWFAVQTRWLGGAGWAWTWHPSPTSSNHSLRQRGFPRWFGKDRVSSPRQSLGERLDSVWEGFSSNGARANCISCVKTQFPAQTTPPQLEAGPLGAATVAQALSPGLMVSWRGYHFMFLLYFANYDLIWVWYFWFYMNQDALCAEDNSTGAALQKLWPF